MFVPGDVGQGCHVQNGSNGLPTASCVALSRLGSIDSSAPLMDPRCPNGINGTKQIFNGAQRACSKASRKSWAFEDAPISTRFRSPAQAIASVLLDPHSERFVAALAPVLAYSSELIPLAALQAQLVDAGRPNRLGWLVENTSDALGTLTDTGDRHWKRTARRAQLALAEFLAHLPPKRGEAEGARDAIDRGIRTKKTLEKTWEAASSISRRWHIVSALT